ncbi:SEC-C metal-binding domain-containing protein [Vibrio sp. OPT18]|uniref:SEC-C metal-binding domain-containing protein n=1 Tax=Vibrio sp. OPT18 TaxID=2778641 RepID=UPI00187E6525|nr:SEC-C domain-containing protein [Vibrio sp. OPT18]
MDNQAVIEQIKIALEPCNKNNPCLCGSGKKYRHCCRKKHARMFKAYQREND